MKAIKNVVALFLIFCTTYGWSTGTADTSLIKSHLVALTQTPKFRTYKNIDQLNETASYIHSVFSSYADSTWEQTYTVQGKTYKNIICAFGIEHEERIVVGAHYDVCGDQEGADDNASGVAGLLELARMLKDQNLNHRIDLVAYTLEEPPFFRTEHMGSYIHARSLHEENARVYGMISLEMIGYFKEEKKSQTYPIGILSLIYGNKGNYITLVKKWKASKFTRKYCRKFKSAKTVRTKKFAGPASIPGIDFSDHLNYWKFGYSALMITDTAFYRNPNYHEKTDTIETLDIPQMAKVINGVFHALTHL